MKTLIETLRENLQKNEPHNGGICSQWGRCLLNTKNLRLPFFTGEFEFWQRVDDRTAKMEKVGTFTWRQVSKIDDCARYGILLQSDDTPIILKKEDRNYQVGVLLETKKPDDYEHVCFFDAFLVELSEARSKTTERVNVLLDWNRRHREASRPKKRKQKK